MNKLEPLNIQPIQFGKKSPFFIESKFKKITPFISEII